MPNESMFGFPRRAYQERFKRSFNRDYAPRFSDLTFWFIADTDVYTDVDCTIAANVGDSVAAWKDQSQYARVLSQGVAASQPTLVIDSGFSALLFSYQMLQTTMSYTGNALTIAVFRAVNSAWNTVNNWTGEGGYGAVMATPSSVQYRFSSGGTGFNVLPAICSKNGQTVTDLSPIDTRMVFTAGWNAPGATELVRVGYSDSTRHSPIYVYEILTYSSTLTSGDIADIETMLMQKYSIGA